MIKKKEEEEGTERWEKKKERCSGRQNGRMHVRGSVKKFPEFFDVDGLVHQDFARLHSVTGHFHVQMLQTLRDAVRRKGSDKWQRQWFMFHDGTPSHISCCAAIPRHVKHFCHCPTTVRSVSRSEWLLAVPNSENWPQEDTFHNNERHEIKCNG
jgi:hypothetical protein